MASKTDKQQQNPKSSVRMRPISALCGTESTACERQQAPKAVRRFVELTLG